MKKGWRVTIVVLVAAVAVIAAAVLCVIAGQFFFKGPFASDLGRVYLSDRVLPVSVTVYGRGSDAGARQDTISARVAFYTPDGDLVGTLERSWPGWELQLDFIVLKNQSGFLVFPWLAYTDETTSGHGVPLAKYYSRAGFPSLYESAQLSANERAALRNLFLLVRSEALIPPFLGSLRHETLKIRNYVPGTEYFIHVMRDGSLELAQ